MTEPLVLVGMLLAAMLVPAVMMMRAGMFWCPKCKTYHYKSVAPTRCYRDYCEMVARRQARLRRMTHGIHSRKAA